MDAAQHHAERSKNKRSLAQMDADLAYLEHWTLRGKTIRQLSEMIAKIRPYTLSFQQIHADITIKAIALADLKPHPRNPRKHPAPGSEEWTTLKRSLADSYFDPLVFNSRNQMLVSGHLRAKVLLEMGVTKADCVVVDFDEDKHVQVMLRANTNSAEWDDTALAGSVLIWIFSRFSWISACVDRIWYEIAAWEYKNQFPPVWSQLVAKTTYARSIIFVSICGIIWKSFSICPFNTTITLPPKTSAFLGINFRSILSILTLSISLTGFGGTIPKASWPSVWKVKPYPLFGVRSFPIMTNPDLIKCSADNGVKVVDPGFASRLFSQRIMDATLDCDPQIGRSGTSSPLTSKNIFAEISEIFPFQGSFFHSLLAAYPATIDSNTMPKTTVHSAYFLIFSHRCFDFAFAYHVFSAQISNAIATATTRPPSDASKTVQKYDWVVISIDAYLIILPIIPLSIFICWLIENRKINH